MADYGPPAAQPLGADRADASAFSVLPVLRW